MLHPSLPCAHQESAYRPVGQETQAQDKPLPRNQESPNCQLEPQTADFDHATFQEDQDCQADDPAWKATAGT